MPERNWSTDWYRYGFQGQEKDDEIKGEGNHMTFSDYGLDTRLGKRWQIDPMSKYMVSWSTYSTFKDNPILLVDPNGEFPFTYHLRTFAPFDYFGGGFTGDGDNRKFTTKMGAKFKIKSEIEIETDNMEVVSANWIGSISKGGYGLWEANSEAHGKYKLKNNNLKSHIYGNNDAATELSSDIDVFTNFEITVKNTENGEKILNIKGEVAGDNFPAAEAYISDSKGNSIFLGVSSAGGGAVLGPYTLLPFENKRPMMEVNINILIDSEGNFGGVKKGSETINIDKHNKTYESKDPKGEED